MNRTKFTLLAAGLALALGFTSCSDDDGDSEKWCIIKSAGATSCYKIGPTLYSDEDFCKEMSGKVEDPPKRSDCDVYVTGDE